MGSVAPLIEYRQGDVAEALKRIIDGRIDRVLLVTPPDAEAEHFRTDTARRLRYPNYPPYGLAVIAQKLRDAGIDVRILNLNHEVLKACVEHGDWFNFGYAWRERVIRTLADFSPDLVAVTCMFTMTHGSFKGVCEYIAEQGYPVAIGGVHVTNDVERVLDDIPVVNMAFLNEAELAMVRLVEVVNGKRPVDDLAQVILVDGKERHRIRKDAKPQAGDIDVIPAYDLLPMEEMSNYGTVGAFYCFKPRGTRFGTVLSNRGCRAQCTFCSVRTFNGVGVRQRSIDSVADEIQLLKDRGIGHLMWLDDDLLKDHRRAIALFNEMVKRNIGITWDATNGLIAASCDDEVVAAMAASGCIAVNIGMESGNPQILRQIKKPGAVKNFLEAAEVFRKYEQIHACVLLMLGFPGETLRMIQDTVNVAREMDLDWHRVVQLQPLPNTPIYDSMVAQGLIQPVGSQNVRFMGGAFGKQIEIEQGRAAATPDFEDAFGHMDLDQVPKPDQLNDIWFYMNYHLNFHRLFTEERPAKMEQQLLSLRMLSDVIAPENGFALYFLGYLQSKLGQEIEPEIIKRLDARLDSSAYWSDRFHAFGLDADDLRTLDFKNKDIPRLLAGQLPQDLDTSPIVGLH